MEDIDREVRKYFRLNFTQQKVKRLYEEIQREEPWNLHDFPNRVLGIPKANYQTVVLFKRLSGLLPVKKDMSPTYYGTSKNKLTLGVIVGEYVGNADRGVDLAIGLASRRAQVSEPVVIAVLRRLRLLPESFGKETLVEESKSC